MAWKFSMGVFRVLLETLGIFWVFIFAPIRPSLLLEIQSTPRALKWQGILTVEALFNGQLPGVSRKSVHTRSQLTVHVTGMFLSKRGTVCKTLNRLATYSIKTRKHIII